MKTLINLVVLLASVAVITVFGFALFQATQEPAAISNLRIEHEIKTMRQWFVIWTIVRYAFGLSLSIGLLALARFAWVRTRTVERLRYEDGLLPALEKDATPWYRKALGETWIAPLNLNHMGGAASLIKINRDGTLDIANDNLGMAPEQQTHLVDGVHSVQRHAAGRRSGETSAEVKGRLGYWEKPAPKTPAAALPAPAIVTNPARLLTLNEAIHHPDGAVLGQNHKTGDLAIWSPPTDGHLSIWGGTRQGKSSRAAMTAALWLIESNYHVLILDIDRGKTWGLLDGWAEFNPTDADLFPAQCKNLMREWKRRTDLLAQHSAYDWSALPIGVGNRPIVVVVEEYHALRTALQASDPAKLDYADKAFSTLARRGAATGIYLMMIDQLPEAWPAGVKSNCLTSMTFAQGFGKGNAVGYYHAHELRQGEFYFRGQTFHSWLAAPEAANLLVSTPKRIKGNHQASPAVRPVSPVEQMFTEENEDTDDTMMWSTGEGEDAGDETTRQSDPAQTIDLQDWLGANEQESRQWVAANPGAGVNELARHLAVFHGRPKSAFRIYQSEASKWWNQFNPRGKGFVPPTLTPDALGDSAELDLSDPAVRAALLEHPESWRVNA